MLAGVNVGQQSPVLWTAMEMAGVAAAETVGAARRRLAAAKMEGRRWVTAEKKGTR